MNPHWPPELAPQTRARIASHFTLNPAWTFLNHGSFGATLKPVQERQRALRAELEQQPVHFFMRRCLRLLDDSRGILADFIGADSEDLAFVTNATSGVNTVLRSLSFEPGDELLTTDHDYNACRQALEYVAKRWGAKVVVVKIPLPMRAPSEVVEGLARAITPRTKLALLDHVTSTTGLIFPLAELVQVCRARGVLTLVDGAHAPGMLPLDLRALGAHFYTANCHKWLCAPKGSAFLYVERGFHDTIVPLTISHGATQNLQGRSVFHQRFDWTGTRDSSAEMCVGLAIKTLDGLLDGGLPAVQERNRALCLAARRYLTRIVGTEPIAPEAMVASLATIAVRDNTSTEGAGYAPQDPLYQLLNAGKIEAPIFLWPKAPHRFVRISAQLYNHRSQYEALGGVLGGDSY